MTASPPSSSCRFAPLPVFIAIALLLLALGEARAAEPDTPEEPSATLEDLDELGDDRLPLGDPPVGELPTWLTDNLRWAVDVAGRIDLPTNGDSSVRHEFLGVDLHKVVSTETRDLGTLLIQLYLKDDDGDWEYTTRLLYFNYLASGGGGFNVRVGHILVPFGLNLPSRTPGTLRQFITKPNVGFKADWGASINGVLPSWNYEVSLTRGSGRSIEGSHDPYLVSGRLGSSMERPFSAGLSALHGKVLTDAGLIRRTRLGADLRWEGGPIDVLATASVGQDETTTEIVNGFAEMSWRSPTEMVLAYLQGRLFMSRPDHEWTETSYATIGARLHIARHYWLSADYRRGITSESRDSSPDVARIQVRYRFF